MKSFEVRSVMFLYRYEKNLKRKKNMKEDDSITLLVKIGYSNLKDLK